MNTEAKSNTAAYIVSRMSGSVSYCAYDFVGTKDSDKAGLLPVVKQKVSIQGGSGIASFKSGFGEMSTTDDGIPMWTADGMVTPVTQQQLDMLEGNVTFQKHLDAGLVRVVKRNIMGNHRAVMQETATMNRDGFTPLTPETAKKRIGGNVQVKTIESETGLTAL